jgi:hypothetical protein
VYDAIDISNMPKNMANKTEEDKAISTIADPVSSIGPLNRLAANLVRFRPVKKLNNLRITHSLSMPNDLLP